MLTAKRMAREALRELTEVPINDMRLKFDSFRESMGLGVLGSAVGLAVAVQNQGWVCCLRPPQRFPQLRPTWATGKTSRGTPPSFFGKHLTTKPGSDHNETTSRASGRVLRCEETSNGKSAIGK